MLPDDALAALRRYPLLDALRERRSRRLGLGMAMPGGPLAHRSRHPGVPLTEDEEALLAFAACGITGPALADLAYAPGQGGTIMAGLLGRTIGSGDAVQSVAVFVTNADATYLLRRPRDFAPGEITELIALAAAGDYVALYRRSRVPVRPGRTNAPLEAPFNLDVNRWSLSRRPSAGFRRTTARWPACSPRNRLESRRSGRPRGGRCGSGSRASFHPAPG